MSQMQDDSLAIPDFLKISPEERKRAWEQHPPKSSRFVDPRLEASKELRKQQKKAENTRRINKLKTSLEKKKNSAPKSFEGLRWCVNRSKWISVDSLSPQEEEMASDGTYSSRGAARKGAKRAGLESFTIVQVGERFKYVTSTDVMAAAADTAPVAAVNETPLAGTESNEMAKKKAKAKSNGAGPSKVEQVTALCERKSGCTLADIKDKLGVSDNAAASLIADVRRGHKSLKRERNTSGISVYYL